VYPELLLVVKGLLKTGRHRDTDSNTVAWWAMNKWLQAFAYRVEISWWMFVLAWLHR
jgi:putative ABC transport system permease protein